MADNTGKTTDRRADTAEAWRMLTALYRTIRSGSIAVNPVDQHAPIGTQVRRIKAYNTLQMVAKPGRDTFCGFTSDAYPAPCILRRGHEDGTYQDGNRHMDAEQRDRAIRYLMLRSAPKTPTA